MNTQNITGVHHVSVRALDLDESIIFYEALGFRQVHEWSLPAYSILRAVMMQASDGRFWLEIFGPEAKIPMQGLAASGRDDVRTGALAHLCLSVGNIEDALAQVAKLGAKLLNGPEDLLLGKPAVTVRNAIIEGPSGEIIELIETVTFPGDLLAS